MVFQVLCINQSDSCAGTGLQADIKTIQAFGGYASTAVTAVTAQDTQGVHEIFRVPTDIIKKQIEVVLEDLKPGVIKTGMLNNTETIDMIGDYFDALQDTDVKIVIDPVMTSRSGERLLDKEAMDALKRRLLIRAHVLTPNIQEAEILTGLQIRDIDEMCHAAEMLLSLGARNVVVKGGALPGESAYDVLCDQNGPEIYQNARHETKATHGAGTTLTAGLAACLAKNMDIHDSFAAARSYLCSAIDTAEVIGRGFGPVNHHLRIEEALEKAA